MKKQIHRDVWVGAVLLVFCAAVLFHASRIPGEAAYLPVALGVLMAVCAAVILIGGLRKSQAAAGAFQYTMTWKNSKYAFQFMLFILIYYLLFRYVSYWVATPFFLLFAQKHLKVKSWKLNIAITVIYMIVSYILFVIVLKLPIYKIGILGKYFRFI